MSKRITIQEFVMADDGTLSAAAELGGADILGLYIPTIVSAVLKFKACDTVGGTYSYVMDNDNHELSIAATTGNFWLSGTYLEPLRGLPFLKIESSVSQTGGPETFKIVQKRVG